MELSVGRILEGPAGRATEVCYEWEPGDQPSWQATVAAWLLNCPGQSPAWDRYSLSIVHLRPVDGVPPAQVRVPGATHELLVLALDPKADPQPLDPVSWRFLRPANVVEQLQLPDDTAAAALAHLAAKSVVHGILPAEPLVAGVREPWRTSLLKTAAHFRGEEHAP